MFGLGLAEIVVIVVAALIFVGPDKLPGMAKTMGKTIRDLRRQTRDLRTVIERDTEIGDAVRELRSAIQDEPPPRPMPAAQEGVDEAEDADAPRHAVAADDAPESEPEAPPAPTLSDDERAKLQAMIDDDSNPFPDIDLDHNHDGDDELLIKPATDTIARGESEPDRDDDR